MRIFKYDNYFQIVILMKDAVKYKDMKNAYSLLDKWKSELDNIDFEDDSLENMVNAVDTVRKGTNTLSTMSKKLQGNKYFVASYQNNSESEDPENISDHSELSGQRALVKSLALHCQGGGIPEIIRYYKINKNVRDDGEKTTIELQYDHIRENINDVLEFIETARSFLDKYGPPLSELKGVPKKLEAS